MLTNHGKDRIRERVQPTKRTEEEMAEFVLNNGIPIQKTSGNLYRWIDRRRKKHNDTYALLYREHLYIYCYREPRILITTFRVPANLRASAERLYKKQRKGLL